MHDYRETCPKKQKPMTMKTIHSITPLVIVALVSGCSAWSPKKNYERGFEEGRASEVRRAYWESKTNQAQVQPVPQYREVEVPAHVTPDGIRIEAHTRQVEITNPTTP